MCHDGINWRETITENTFNWAGYSLNDVKSSEKCAVLCEVDLHCSVLINWVKISEPK